MRFRQVAGDHVFCEGLLRPIDIFIWEAKFWFVFLFVVVSRKSHCLMHHRSCPLPSDPFWLPLCPRLFLTLASAHPLHSSCFLLPHCSATCSPCSFPGSRMAQALPMNCPTAMVSGILGWAKVAAGLGVGWDVVCAVPPPCFLQVLVLLQMNSPGPGLPNPPLLGSSCHSVKLRSAAAEGERAADPRPRQCPVPTGEDTPSRSVFTSRRVLFFLDLCGAVCLDVICLRGAWLGGLGSGAWLHHPSVPSSFCIQLSCHLAPLYLSCSLTVGDTHRPFLSQCCLDSSGLGRSGRLEVLPLVHPRPHPFPSSDHDDRWETKEEAVSPAPEAPQPTSQEETPMQVRQGWGSGGLGPHLSLTCCVPTASGATCSCPPSS